MKMVQLKRYGFLKIIESEDAIALQIQRLNNCIKSEFNFYCMADTI